VTLALALGATTSLLGGAAGFAAARWALAQKPPQIFGAIAAGMLAKMVLLAAGLVLTVRAGAPAWGFVAAFFAVYVLAQTAEVAWVARRLKSA
jgi:hypothetical protein